MDNLEEKLTAALQDPQMMEQVMALAKNLGQGGLPPGLPVPGQGSVNKDQQQLLQALRPYLSAARISRLERAMRAAGMAGMATAMLSLSGGKGG